MSRDPRDWQADMTLCEKALRKEGLSVSDIFSEQPQMSMYWLQQYKEAVENLTDSYNELSWSYGQQKKELEKAEWSRDRNFNACSKMESHLKAAEEREQKLKEAMEIAIRDGGKYENPYESLVYLQSVLATLYPLDREDTNDN